MKERIIGAIVLVAVVVLVVPVFLDGPPENGEIISERVPLPGQTDQEIQTVVLDRDRSEPVPAPSEPRSEPQPMPAEPAPQASETQVVKPAPKQPPPSRDPVEAPDTAGTAAASVAPAASSATGMWAVQIGSFSNQQNAERLAADLRKQGFAAFLSQLQTPSGPLHRVRIGPQKDREAAEAMAARLQKAGHKGTVLPHP
ncbi:MAG: SPOR domain-containing protein [Woeseiaceae bacterium]|nr:SPOR domain-containing protein [Woeseiaceae bacterium]